MTTLITSPELDVKLQMSHNLSAWNQLCMCAEMLHQSREDFLLAFVIYAVQRDLMLDYVRRDGR